MPPGGEAKPQDGSSKNLVGRFMQDLNLNLNLFIYLFSLNYFIIAQNLAKISYGNELQVST